MGIHGCVRRRGHPLHVPEFFAPEMSDLELWLTFAADSLTTNASLGYPTGGTRPASPTVVLDRSSRNRHATVSGSVTFDVLQGNNAATLSGAHPPLDPC